jgi:hypothetical protein
MNTSSSHLIFGLPLLLVAYSFPYYIFFGIVVSCILSIWPSHRIFWHLINLTMVDRYKGFQKFEVSLVICCWSFCWQEFWFPMVWFITLSDVSYDSFLTLIFIAMLYTFTYRSWFLQMVRMAREWKRSVT